MIIPATLEDIAAIKQLNEQFNDIFREKGIAMPMMCYTIARWIEENLECYKVWKNGDVRGAICVSPIDDREYYIDTLTVSPAYHGEGIGRALIEHAIAASRESGIQQLYVDSFQVFDVKEFYLKCGFELLAETPAEDNLSYWQFTMEL